jgi:hypothetical protein
MPLFSQGVYNSELKIFSKLNNRLYEWRGMEQRKTNFNGDIRYYNVLIGTPEINPLFV